MTNILEDLLDQKHIVQSALENLGYKVSIKRFILGIDICKKLMSEVYQRRKKKGAELGGNIIIEGTIVNFDSDLDDDEILLAIKLEKK